MFKRSDISFLSSGIKMRAWLYLPDERENPPLVIMGHGLSGIRELGLAPFAERFTKAGFAALVFDYRHFGDSDGEPRHLLDIQLQREDWQAAVDFARTLPSIDTQRIALWGTSLAGGHVLKVAASDRNVAAVISQCPFTSGTASAFAAGLRGALGSGSFGVFDEMLGFMGLGPLLVPVVGTPGTPALMTAPDALAGILSLAPPGSVMSRQLSRLFKLLASRDVKLPEGVTFGDFDEPLPISRLVGSMRMPSGTYWLNGVAGRFALRIGLDNPGAAMKDLACPTLVCVCAKDSVAPPDPTLKFAKGLNQVETIVYEAGHFDIYVGEMFEKLVADEIAFLKKHLGE
jgi:fermentation-respiration switch protein FrsA (DUF1100 family)